MNLPSAHSLLGASGSHRWMVCPGSIALSSWTDPEPEFGEDDDTFSRPGTAAHSLLAACLEGGTEAWTYIGEEFDGIAVNKEMADNVQSVIFAIRDAHPDRDQGHCWIERPFHCPEVHDKFYGTADFVYWDEDACVLHVWDFKYGAGVVVDVENNPQLMYYGVGVLTDLGLWASVSEIVLHIAQPRGFHFDGPVREWMVENGPLAEWRDTVLVPAMFAAEEASPDDTASGEHCRFCPVKYRNCPQHEKDADELEELLAMVGSDGSGAEKMTNEQLARFMHLKEVMKIKVKPVEQIVFGRLQAGQKIEGAKLVKAKSNREFRDGAEATAKKKFGKRAYTEPKLKSPADFDKMAGGTAFTTEWAYKPDKGLTLASDFDGRAAVTRQPVEAVFKNHAATTEAKPKVALRRRKATA